MQELCFGPKTSPILTSGCILISIKIWQSLCSCNKKNKRPSQLQRKKAVGDKTAGLKAQQGCLPVYILVAEAGFGFCMK